MKSVDFLVAVRNEEKSIPFFINKVNKLAPNDVNVNIIFSEVGSKDGTVNVLRDFLKNNVDYISLKNKYDQYTALFYGLGISKAYATITMDVNGGNPVGTAVEMIKAYLAGNNLVQRHQIIYKRKKYYRTIMSYAYNLFFYIIVGVNFFEQNVMFRLMDKSTKDKFLQNKNWWNIFKTNFKSKDGIKTSYIKYEAPERELGESKYDFFRLFKLSYKSFFSLLPLSRLVIINLFPIAVTILFIRYGLLLLVIFFLTVMFVINISYFIIVKHYTIPLLKIIETSFPEIKK